LEFCLFLLLIYYTEEIYELSYYGSIKLSEYLA
jgi:hypothetical protein